MHGRYDLRPLFLGRLRPERLTSYQAASQLRISFAWRHKQPIYFFRPQWAESAKFCPLVDINNKHDAI